MPTAAIPTFDDDGQVVPRKLINPNVESREKQSLHRELKFNQKM